MPEQPSQERRGIDWHDVRQKAVTALVIAILLGGGALVWNSLSNERVLKLLGGVSQSELEATIKRLTLMGPPGPQGVPGDVLPGAVVAFDGPCPPGWKLFDDVVGSAIVGYGATMVGETGEPLPSGAILSRRQAQKKTGDAQYTYADGVYGGANIAPDPSDFSLPISRYLPKVKTAMTPTYLPLMYCKRDGAYSDYPSKK